MVSPNSIQVSIQKGMDENLFIFITSRVAPVYLGLPTSKHKCYSNPNVGHLAIHTHTWQKDLKISFKMTAAIQGLKNHNSVNRYRPQ